MRRFSHRHPWTILVMVVLLLFGTSGVTLSRMTCLLGGHTVVGLGLLEDCCPEDEEHDAPVVKSLCCDFGAAFSSIDDVLPSPPQESPAVNQAAHGLALASSFTGDAESIAWLTTRPPPRTVTERLSEMRLLRI
ncbi:MAG: hypothetical protein IPM46_07700 [Flavobacteriales bacterium]|nr:hypothetical protein [Flavobacteriales bacterium]